LTIFFCRGVHPGGPQVVPVPPRGQSHRSGRGRFRRVPGHHQEHEHHGNDQRGLQRHLPGRLSCHALRHDAVQTGPQLGPGHVARQHGGPKNRTPVGSVRHGHDQGLPQAQDQGRKGFRHEESDQRTGKWPQTMLNVVITSFDDY
jgi:hypothetical protein